MHPFLDEKGNTLQDNLHTNCILSYTQCVCSMSVTECFAVPVTEFRMPVPWGEMRGRIWGPEHGRPVLCVHGWSDNSGSFNNLIPLLPAGAVTFTRTSYNHLLYL